MGKLKTLALLGGALAVFAGSAQAQQNYPNRPVEIVVPFAAGGSIDITMRVIAPSMSKRLGQQVVILNKAGGGATIGMADVARANPDGYTLGAASFAFAANPYVLDKMPYDTANDFAPVTMVASSPMLMLVNPKTPVTTLPEFIAWVKSQPAGSLNYGSVGVASSGHMISELFMSQAGIKMTHVPYNQGPLPALVAGEIQLQIGPIPSSISLVQGGQLRAIGVTSLNQDPNVPDQTPVSKFLPGFDTYEWPGIVAPKGTPRAIIDRIQKEVKESVNEPEVKQRLATLGSLPAGTTPEQFAEHIKKEMATWQKVASQLNIKAQ